MVIVSSAVLGAATGTGLALLVAVTIVVYRYYLVKRRGKEWAELDRWEEKRAARKIHLQVCGYFFCLFLNISQDTNLCYI